MGANKKVLVVDDEEFLVELLAVNLQPAGFNVIKAYNGEDGLKKTQDEKPDLVILDIRMPGMDGLEVCRRLKSDDKTRQIPVLMLSAFAQDKDIKKGLDAGAEDYVKKPFDVLDLLVKVKQMLSM